MLLSTACCWRYFKSSRIFSSANETNRYQREAKTTSQNLAEELNFALHLKYHSKWTQSIGLPDDGTADTTRTSLQKEEFPNKKIAKRLSLRELQLNQDGRIKRFADRTASSPLSGDHPLCLESKLGIRKQQSDLNLLTHKYNNKLEFFFFLNKSSFLIRNSDSESVSKSQQCQELNPLFSLIFSFPNV